MMILSIILGILMIITGACCLFTPLTTYLATGYFMCVMLLFYGIAGLVYYFKKKGPICAVSSASLKIFLAQ